MFALYPWMMACHLIVNIVCILRNIAFSAVGPGEHNAFAYYLSGLLGVHSFHEDRGKDKALVGLKRVIDDKRARFRTERREWDSQLTFQFVSLLFPFTQGFFATWLYFRRKKLSPTGSGVYLGFDHRNGWMAIGGTLASLAAIARLILGYDWVKKENTQWWEMRIDASAQVDSLDTSNAFVYEGLLAFMVQIVSHMSARIDN